MGSTGSGCVFDRQRESELDCELFEFGSLLPGILLGFLGYFFGVLEADVLSVACSWISELVLTGGTGGVSLSFSFF